MQINFIDWVAFKDVMVDANMSLAEYCTQYSAVQTSGFTPLQALSVLSLFL